jgi:ATP-binding cassette subfamily G (WHITE) protein 2 (SNQ2)
MVLVLGRPGSGVTTLLRVLSSDWDGYSSVSGYVDYGGLPASTIRSRLRGEVCYLSADDLHFPTVPVGETLLLALRCKTPARRPRGETRSRWQRRQLKGLSRYLGLHHALKTPVGNELIQGVSGGERKRVSVGELLATRASVLCLDNPTNGLDSSTALDLIFHLKRHARTGRRSVIAGLRQVGEGLYRQFDTVVVLHHGRQIYHGPVTEARAYFENLGFRPVPGQTTADFLCACTDRATQQMRSDAEAPIPRSSSQLTAIFRSSEQFRRLRNSLVVYDERYTSATTLAPLQRALNNEKDSLTPRWSIYTVNFFRQVLILARRQYALIRADLRPYVTKTVVNVTLSLLVGTLFLDLPKTTEGAFTRGSVLLLSILFNGYLQLAELGNTLAGRPVVRRQRQYGFYMPSALAVARTLSDLPLIAAQVMLFASITYLLAGLQVRCLCLLSGPALSKSAGQCDSVLWNAF